MITRKVDRRDALAGFTYRWVSRLAASTDSLDVICLEAGDTSGLPGNCRVFSLGKEHGKNRWREFWRFQSYARKLIRGVDGVFSHQNPEYAILIAPWAILAHKRLVAWYTHKAVTLRRRIMELAADRICTASPESFRKPLFPKKVRVLGHGIDTDFFSYHSQHGRERNYVISVGRLSPSKRDGNLIVAAAEEADIRLDLVGGTMLQEHAAYERRLREIVEDYAGRDSSVKERIRLIGWVPHAETVNYYRTAALFVNTSATGSIDKAVLEAMASGCLVLTSNEAFAKLLPPDFFTRDDNPPHLRERIRLLLAMPEHEREQHARKLRSIVVQHHNLDALIKKMIQQFV